MEISIHKMQHKNYKLDLEILISNSKTMSASCFQSSIRNLLKSLILLTCMIKLLTKSGRNRTREIPKAINVTPKRWYLQHHDAMHCLFLLPSISKNLW